MADDNDIVVLDDVESTEESYVNLVSYVRSEVIYSLYCLLSLLL